MIGQIFGNYKILQTLGEGGVGMVYKGIDTMLDREVAIKVLRPELANQTSVVERFRSEAVTLAKLNHPNIATLFSLFRHGNSLFMVLEFINGESLEALIQRRGRLSVEEAVRIFCQALDGIGYAHHAGIIHRDIKPSNLILTTSGMVKVLDFGIARFLGSSRMTRVGNIIGTLEYMSPEQVRGEETDARSDIYGLGIMLYELLTGKLPFVSENEFELMKMQTEQMPAPPRQLNSDIPIEIEAAIMKALEKNPAGRFQNASDFLETLLAVDLPLSGVGSLAVNNIINPKKQTRSSNSGIEQAFPAADKSVSANQIVTLPPTKISKPLKADPETEELTPVDLDKTERLTQPENLEIPKPWLPPWQTESLVETRQTHFNENESEDSEVEQTSFEPQPLAANLTDKYFDENHSEKRSASTSFFQKLTWMHYAGAGAAIIILFSLLGIAIIFPMIFGGGRSETSNANYEAVKSEENDKPHQVNPIREGNTKTLSEEAKSDEENSQSQPTYTFIEPSQTPSNFGALPLSPVEKNPTDPPPASEERPKAKPSNPKPERPAETKKSERKSPDVRRETPKSGGTRKSNPAPSATPSLTDN